ncbi:MAG: PRC-barrel domain-containing protein [Candidatus Limnocylindria bacterium]
MRTTKELAGLAVIDVRDGKKLGTVSETVVSPDDGRLLGFVLKSGGMLSREESAVEIDDVRSIGADAITVEGEEIIHRPEATQPSFQEARNGDRALVGRKIVTQNGTVVGQVADLVVNEESRRVGSILIGGGMFESSDAIPAARVVSVGPDVVIVTDEGVPDETVGPFET